MAQDYYFNSHNPNNHSNKNDGPAPKRPGQNQVKKSQNAKGPSAPNNRRPVQQPASRQGGNLGASPRRGSAGSSMGAQKPVSPAVRRPVLSNQGKPSDPQGNRHNRPFNTQKKDAAAGLSKTKLNMLRVIFGSLVVCAFTCIVLGLTVLIYSINFVNGEVALDLDTEKFAQAQTTFVYGNNMQGEEIELARLHGSENRIWVDMEDMSPYIKQAFIALEDKRFEKHHGVDWFRTLSAIFIHGGSQGGSTITQQLIKNLTDQKSVTFVRKFNEILIALNLEKHYEKDEIIEAYLNTIFLSQGCYGVETAAITYFGKDISELNLAECATLAAITQWPNKYDPLRSNRTVTNEDGSESVINYVQNNKDRQELCLSFMLEQDMISEAEYNEAVNYKLIFTNSPEYTGKSAAATAKSDTSQKAGDYNSYYVDFVIQQVAQQIAAKEGITAAKAQKQVIRGGYKIYTAMDYAVQQALEEVFENYVDIPDTEAQAAMTVMDYKGRVVGIIGGMGKKSGDMVLNRASQSPRSPGSTIKPLSIYAPALELNATYWSNLWTDSASRKSEEEPWLNGSGWPHNDSNEGGDGNKVTVQYALARSLNTVPVRILTDIGFEASKNFLEQKAHLTTLVEGDASYGALSLGSLTNGATTLEMTAAYQMFGNGGYYYAPYAYTKVVNSRNEIVFENEAEKNKEQVLSPANATVMNKLLQTVSASGGSGSPYHLNTNDEMFAKTGTTTGSKDRWFIAGTPYYVAAVWYGYDTPKEIVFRWNGSRANPAGVLWYHVMNKVHKLKDLSAAKFEASSDAVQRKYCTVTGRLATSSCPTAYGWYDSANLPATCSGGHGSSNNNNSNSNEGNNNNTPSPTPETPETTAENTTPPPPETTTAPEQTTQSGGGDNSGNEGDKPDSGNGAGE